MVHLTDADQHFMAGGTFFLFPTADSVNGCVQLFGKIRLRISIGCPLK